MKDMLGFLKILANETRLKIIIMLSQRDMCVCEIMDELGMSQPAVSHHLRLLKKNGIVRDDKDGRWVFYVDYVPRNIIYIHNFRYAPSNQGLLKHVFEGIKLLRDSKLGKGHDSRTIIDKPEKPAFDSK